MRTLVHALAIVVGLALVAPSTPAYAQDVKALKGKVKEAKKELKSLDKIIKKYGKAIDKGKDTASLDEDVNQLVKGEIQELRQMGVKINAPDPEPVSDGAGHELAPPESDTPWLDKFGDQLLAVREAKNPKPRLKQLEELRPMMATKLERAEKKLDKAK